jgi:hypothetical protein
MSPRASVASLVNLLQGYKPPEKVERVAKLGEQLLKLQEKRHDLAHLRTEPRDAKSVTLLFLSSSKRQVRTEKHITIAQMDEWTDKMTAYTGEIEQIISELTGWPWNRVAATAGLEAREVAPHSA